MTDKEKTELAMSIGRFKSAWGWAAKRRNELGALSFGIRPQSNRLTFLFRWQAKGSTLYHEFPVTAVLLLAMDNEQMRKTALQALETFASMELRP